MPDDQADPFYDPDAIFDEDGPIDPVFMVDAVQMLMRAMPLATNESDNTKRRHWQSALTALAATNPRDSIEVMLGVQAISAYQAAGACWRISMNSISPETDRCRHISAASTAARTFDAMLRALERRQAKPLEVPAGRPGRRVWLRLGARNILDMMAGRITRDDATLVEDRHCQTVAPPPATWSPEDVAFAEKRMEQDRIAEENAGLDLAKIEGILPGGGIIMPVDPTNEQAAYIGRRMGLMYKREHAENLRKGLTVVPKIRPIKPGDFIP